MPGLEMSGYGGGMPWDRGLVTLFHPIADHSSISEESIVVTQSLGSARFYRVLHALSSGAVFRELRFFPHKAAASPRLGMCSGVKCMPRSASEALSSAPAPHGKTVGCSPPRPVSQQPRRRQCSALTAKDMTNPGEMVHSCQVTAHADCHGQSHCKVLLPAGISSEPCFPIFLLFTHCVIFQTEKRHRQ